MHWLRMPSADMQIELGDCVTINQADDNEPEDLIVARITEIVYTLRGRRRIGVWWMYRIQVRTVC